MQITSGGVDIEDIDGFLDEIRGIREEFSCVVQGFDPRYIAGERHLVNAYNKALRACRRGEMVSDDISMEVLLYAAGTRQIEVALGIGLSEEIDQAVFLVDDGACLDALGEIMDLGAEVELGDPTHLTDFFGVTNLEIDAVGEEKLGLLVLERVALLDIDK